VPGRLASGLPTAGPPSVERLGCVGCTGGRGRSGCGGDAAAPTVMDLGTAGFVVAFVALALGGVVQSTIGFGLVVFALPLLIQVDPALVPVPVMVASVPLTALMVSRHRGAVRVDEVALTALGRLPGLGVGLAATAALSRDQLATAAAALVLVAVFLSLGRWHPRRTPGTLVAGGFASAVMGVAAGIGGPAIALLYQRSHGRELRGTMSAMNVIAMASSLAALSIGGRVTAELVRTGALLMPAPLVGFVVATPLRSRIDGFGLRAAVLGVCAASAVIALVRLAVT